MSSPYRIRLDPTEKDVLIAKLKGQIVELEDNQRNYDSLNKKYHILKHDFNNLNDIKNKQEYENSTIKMENSQLHRDLVDLEERYNIAISDRDKKIKKLFEDNTKLQQDYDEYFSICEDLQNKLNIITDDMSITDRKYKDTSDTLNKYKERVNKLTEDNINLNKICEEQESMIISNQNIQNENASLKEDNSKLFEAKNYLETSINQLESQLNKLFCDNTKFEKILRIRDDELLSLKEQIDRFYSDNTKLYEEVQNYKHQNNILSDQNKSLIDQLEMVKEQDQVIKSHLQRRHKLADIVHQNKAFLNNKYED